MRQVLVFLILVATLCLTICCANETVRYRNAFRHIEADSSFYAFWRDISGREKSPAIAVSDSIYPISMAFFLDEIVDYRNPGIIDKSSWQAAKDSARAREYRRNFPAYPAGFAKDLSTGEKEQLIVVFSEMIDDQMTAMVFPARKFDRRSPLRKIANFNDGLQYLFFFDGRNAIKKVYVKRLTS